MLHHETRGETDLAMLHDVELSQPGLIERITGGVYNMTKSVLFCEDQHRVQKTFHRLGGFDKSRTSIVNDKQNFKRHLEQKLPTVYVLHRRR